MTATKVAAVLGVDGFGGTRYQLWHQLAGHWCPEVEVTDPMVRGTCLEKGVAEYWLADHPDHEIQYAGTWQSREYDWAYATPDYVVREPDGTLSLLEVKTSSRLEGFGESGTNIIPPYYWAQIAWQCIVTGADRVHITVLGGFLERRDYVFNFDDFTLYNVKEEVSEFIDTLPGRPGEFSPLPSDPALDWEAALAVTPVTEDSIDVTPLYEQYAEYKREGRAIESEADRLRKEIITATASAKVAKAGEKIVAKRTKTGTFRFSPVKS